MYRKFERNNLMVSNPILDQSEYRTSLTKITGYSEVLTGYSEVPTGYSEVTNRYP